MTRRTLGELEEQILLTLLHARQELYAVPLVADLEARTGRVVSTTAAYVVLRRLERRGFVTSRLGEPTATRGGRPRRSFTPTAEAVTALQTSRRALLTLWSGLEDVLGKE